MVYTNADTLIVISKLRNLPILQIILEVTLMTGLFNASYVKENSDKKDLASFLGGKTSSPLQGGEVRQEGTFRIQKCHLFFEVETYWGNFIKNTPTVIIYEQKKEKR